MPGEMWAVVATLLPEEPAKPKGGRPRVPDRDALRGIVFVPRSGLPWEMRTREAFGCPGMTCRRRLRDWQQACVWGRLHRGLLERLDRAGELDWSRASLDAASIGAERAPSGAAAQTAEVRRRVDTSAKLGRHRRVGERTFAWFAQFRRLATRYDRRADIHMAFTKLATAIVRMNQIRRFCWAI